MRSLSSLVRPNILSLAPYSSARSEYSGKGSVFLDANENPFGIYNRYPDPMQKALKEELSGIKNINPESIFIGNGSDEVIDLCYRIFCRPGVDNAITIIPSYGMYDVSAAINDINLIKIPLDQNFQLDANMLLPYNNDENTKLLILCSPNNPTGNLLENIDDVINNFEGIVLVDEAYIDFAGSLSYIQKLATHPNLIVTQTLSKAYGLAAARVGIAYASREIIRLFNKVKPPYNVSALNQSAALTALKEREEYENQKQLLLTERKRVAEVLINAPAVKKVYPSDANFLLIAVDGANELYQYLLNLGIITRNRNTQIPGCIRITIGTPTENDELLNAILQFSI
ncbi:MAG: histidinol-phosphate transaminase [Bacteroidetes bacterium 43-93]|nr:histidinol-phosphate transaminase [Bacteroidota bacterium]OJW98915.1 MAG: histidinol-phosphate transaminase [Bacteroidetes bacterium 43-93]